MVMNLYDTYLMTMTLERSKSGNSIKDFVEQFRKNMFIEDEDKKKTLYISLNAFIKDWEFFFASDLYEPHDVPEEFVLIENLYDRDAIRIKLDDLTDEKILAYSKEITGEEKMPIVEFYHEDNGSIDMFIGFYYKDFQECENTDPD